MEDRKIMAARNAKGRTQREEAKKGKGRGERKGWKKLGPSGRRGSESKRPSCLAEGNSHSAWLKVGKNRASCNECEPEFEKKKVLSNRRFEVSS